MHAAPATQSASYWPGYAAQQVAATPSSALQPVQGQVAQPSAAAVSRHTPPTQLCEPLHTVEHEPQCNGSEPVLVTHAAPLPIVQLVVTPMHLVRQEPDWQASPDGHTWPQEPQLPGSLVVSTHAPPHDESPGRHTHPEAPLQYCPAAQASPQPPQWPES